MLFVAPDRGPFCSSLKITKSSSLHRTPVSKHKLQPLDRSVYGPLKSTTTQHVTDHPGRTMSICDVTGMVGTITARAMMPATIRSGYSKTQMSCRLMSQTCQIRESRKTQIHRHTRCQLPPRSVRFQLQTMNDPHQQWYRQ